MPKRAPKPKEEPDALVWRNDEGDWGFACAHCSMISIIFDDLGRAFEAATEHLWWKHSKRRSWVKHANPDFARAVQLALPIVIALHHSPNRN